MAGSSGESHFQSDSSPLPGSSSDDLETLRRLLFQTPPEPTAQPDDLEALRALLLTLDQTSAPSELTELRHLLMGPEQARLDQLQHQLEDPALLAETVGSVLPEAILLRSTADKRLLKAMSPMIAEVLQVSVKKNPKLLADILFPILGPLIRKSISAALSSMIQTLNQALEHSFSAKGLKWRFEAWSTGRSFAEVVLVNTLVYRVEQLFLIHKQTGLLLCHVANTDTAPRDPDLVSGMLTAIQDFAQDSFTVEQGAQLETLQVGDLNVWIEQGPKAVLAAVIRGNAPHTIRTTFQDALETIHLEQSQAFDEFQGDVSFFENCRPTLEACLLAQFGDHKSSSTTLPWPVLAAAAVLLVLAAGWGGYEFWQYRKWNRYLDRLRAEPGIVVISTGTSQGKFTLTGLRDPLASQPEALLKETGLGPHQVLAHWEAYLASSPPFVLHRAIKLLNPPSTVTLEFSNGTLLATGTASHRWIQDANRFGSVLPGVVKIQTSQVIDADLVQFDTLKAKIEQTELFFGEGTTLLIPGQEQLLAELTRNLQQLNTTAMTSGFMVSLEIFGHTDQTGTDELNQRLSLERADVIRLHLIQQGVITAQLASTGAGTSLSQSVEATPQPNEAHRKVTFRVKFEEISLSPRSK